MNSLRQKNPFGKLMLAVAVTTIAGALQVSCSDVWSEQHPGNYYINSGETVATFLENHPSGEFTKFVYILKAANIWGEMKTYGEHTLFAPTNDAIDEYLKQRREEAQLVKDQYKRDSIIAAFASVETLPFKVCDSIAKTHLCTKTFYCADMGGDGAFPYPNMLDRFLSYYSYEDTIWTDEDGNNLKNKEGRDTFKIKVAYRVNQESKIIEDDDSVQNGVVHIIDKVLRPSNKFLSGLLKENKEISIFTKAIFATKLSDTLDMYVDPNYTPVSYDSTVTCYHTTPDLCAVIYSTAYESDEHATWPEQRKFMYTLFAVPDSILRPFLINQGCLAEGDNDENAGLDALRKYAESVYPDGKGKADTLRESSLNQLISYHILPMILTYDQLNTSQQELLDILAAGVEPDMSEKHARRRRGSGRKTAVRPVRFAPFGDDFSRADQFRDGRMRRGLIRDIRLHRNGIRRRLHALETPLRTALPAHPLDAQQLVDALRDVVAGDDLSATFHKCVQFL